MKSGTMTRDKSEARHAERRAMIDSQLRTSGVNEEFVLARMMAVPREDHLPADKASLAYIDRSTGLGADRHLASPLFYGKLLQEAAPRPSDTALIIEGGTQYLSQLLEPLVERVEIASPAQVLSGDLPEGTFSLVLVDGAIEHVPEHLAAKLEEQGRMVAGLVSRGVTRLSSGRRLSGQLSLIAVEDMGIPVLTRFNRPKTWTFS